MKTSKFLLAFVLLFAATASSMVWAHGHARVGIYVGTPFFWPGYYAAPYPYYGYGPYYNTTTVITQPAPVYIEQAPAPGPAPAPRGSSNSWYYCSNPDGYYPYIKECPAGWQRVAPQP
ncbi:MAG: hypothetical protein ACXU7D_06100 [Burkholderiaceae bacterium]